MQVLSAASLLNLWEDGIDRSPLEQALLLLHAGFPERSPVELAQLTIGQRDALLLRMREQTFGSKLTGLSVCEDCGERLESSFTVGEILESIPAHDNAISLSLETHGYSITFRLPTIQDLQNESDVKSLLVACIREAKQDSTLVAPAILPEHVRQAVIEKMENSDPLANVNISFTCPNCGKAWHSLFDIVSFFWSEVSAWAVRMLREVHVLASAYGWSEESILSMSAWRRQCYLEMVSA